MQEQRRSTRMLKMGGIGVNGVTGNMRHHISASQSMGLLLALTYTRTLWHAGTAEQPLGLLLALTQARITLSGQPRGLTLLLTHR